MISRGSGNPNDQPLYDRLWGSGFLPTTYQGIKFRSVGDPVLYLSNPAGLSAAARRRTLDDLSRLDALNHREFGDPEILTRIAQYEMAFRMQTSVPELIDLSRRARPRLRHVRPRLAHARDLRRQLPAGAPARRTGRSLHPALPPRLGPAYASAHPDRRPVPRYRSSVGRPRHGPQSSAACSTTPWSSGAANSAGPSTARAH